MAKATEDRILRTFQALLEKQAEEIVPWDLEKLRIEGKKTGKKASSMNRDETDLQAAGEDPPSPLKAPALTGLVSSTQHKPHL